MTITKKIKHHFKENNVAFEYSFIESRMTEVGDKKFLCRREKLKTIFEENNPEIKKQFQDMLGTDVEKLGSGASLAIFAIAQSMVKEDEKRTVKLPNEYMDTLLNELNERYKNKNLLIHEILLTPPLATEDLRILRGTIIELVVLEGNGLCR